ncbi:MAG TPA: class I SAM-dependent RNA methyltransferase [Pyrinomonadaceae bacterium]|nr:class I SAM-dependent RNA methyltransferase [Pyrinomonadaceae bacterium]
MRKRKRPRPAPPPPVSDERRPEGAGVEYEVEVERILPGGMGLAHAGGRTVLVALAATGDRLRVRVESVRGAVAFASIVEILAPSPVRVAPPCPYFGRCGGCDFQQLTYEAQLASKVEIIRDCLRRIARIEPPADIHITPAPDPWRYRSRAGWQFDAHTETLGYYQRGSHRVCDVQECPVVVPALQERLSNLRAEMHAHALPPRAHEFQAAAGDEGVTLAPPVNAHDAHENSLRIGDEHYRFDADCFFQINHDLLEPLVRDATRDAHGNLALDLYCGVGLFTLPLARRFSSVVGVEGNPSASRYARRNLDRAGLANARIETGSVGPWLKHHAAELAPADFVLLDPPRAGAEPETLEGIVALQPPRITYVSCDPATLARDLRTLTAHGYRLHSLAAFDMFPQTHHVETLAQLTLLMP